VHIHIAFEASLSLRAHAAFSRVFLTRDCFRVDKIMAMVHTLNGKN
jgi:hypothetical protein